MTGFKIGAAALGLIIAVLGVAPVGAWERGDVDVLSVLPDVTPGVPSSVEGLTVGSDGNIYTTSFGFNTTGALTGNAVLFVNKPNGELVRKVAIANSSPHMLGLAFNPVNNFLLVLDFGAGKVLHVDPVTGASSVFMGPIANSGLNALTFDKAGNVYVSDSFNGVIWKTGPSGGAPTAWSSDPLLGPGTGLTPPFGANGVAFNNAGTTMFVANTAFHQIIQIPLNSNGTAGKASIFTTGINAPDGIAIDRDDNLWVCANQEDNIVVIDKTGKVIAKLGDFRGIGEDGIVRGLLFPASLAFSNERSTLYVSNLTCSCRSRAPRRRSIRPIRCRSRATRCPNFPPESRHCATDDLDGHDDHGQGPPDGGPLDHPWTTRGLFCFQTRPPGFRVTSSLKRRAR